MLTSGVKKKGNKRTSCSKEFKLAVLESRLPLDKKNKHNTKQTNKKPTEIKL